MLRTLPADLFLAYGSALVIWGLVAAYGWSYWTDARRERAMRDAEDEARDASLGRK